MNEWTERKREQRRLNAMLRAEMRELGKHRIFSCTCKLSGVAHTREQHAVEELRKDLPELFNEKGEWGNGKLEHSSV